MWFGDRGRVREEGREGGRTVGTVLGQLLSIVHEDFEVMRIVPRDCPFTMIRLEWLVWVHHPSAALGLLSYLKGR